jgi:hypothetical protein
VAREAIVPSAATAAAAKNNEQKIRRHRDDTNVRFAFAVIRVAVVFISGARAKKIPAIEEKIAGSGFVQLRKQHRGLQSKRGVRQLPDATLIEVTY